MNKKETRTHHTPGSRKAQKPNRLWDARSVYLRQHAHDPVDWHPWGPEAFGKAQRERKPIFLSIGYATCHWCHVMQRESFSDPTVAAFLNQHFVSVKVDRQERPDVDELYMEIAAAAGAPTGWPLNLVLTPEGVPFLAGTYFPTQRRGGYPCFMEFLERAVRLWGEHAQKQGGQETLELLRHTMAQLHRPKPGQLDLRAAEDEALAKLAAIFDQDWGGFGAPPKFPMPAKLFFLLEQASRAHKLAQEMLFLTLEGMAAGGMYDVLSGGFHRYSVDRFWFVPHYEKMLPDNALLARLYLEAGCRLKRASFRAVGRKTLSFLSRKLCHRRRVHTAEGPKLRVWFAAGLDADTAGTEGATYTFTWEDLTHLLSAEELELLPLVSWFGPDQGRHAPLPARFVGLDAQASYPFAREQCAQLYRSILRKLSRARSHRPDPELDTLDVTAWNSMAVWAANYAGSCTGCSSTEKVASELLETAKEKLTVPRNFLAGVTQGPETLEDLAWTVAALLECYEATGEHDFLATAAQLTQARLPRYQDVQGGLYTTPEDGEKLLYRRRSLGDGAHFEPEAWMAFCLYRLALITENPEFSRWADAALGAAAGRIQRNPEEHCTWLLAARLARERRVLVVAGDRRWASTKRLLRAAYKSPVPPQVLVCPHAWPPDEAHLALVPQLSGKEPQGPEQAFAYLCTGNFCLPPVSDPKALIRLLVKTAQTLGAG